MTCQIKHTGGGWIDAPLLEDAVLVNLGSLMQHWTSDFYKATVSTCNNNSARGGRGWDPLLASADHIREWEAQIRSSGINS